jgi:hypothetical protein
MFYEALVTEVDALVATLAPSAVRGAQKLLNPLSLPQSKMAEQADLRNDLSRVFTLSFRMLPVRRFFQGPQLQLA